MTPIVKIKDQENLVCQLLWRVNHEVPSERGIRNFILHLSIKLARLVVF